MRDQHEEEIVDAEFLPVEPAPTVAQLRRDPCTPTWALNLMQVLESKDPVDAASVLEVLASAYRDRARSYLRDDDEDMGV